jgi:hypothetical protein
MFEEYGEIVELSLLMEVFNTGPTNCGLEIKLFQKIYTALVRV